jgi:hypothetical protein
MYQIYAELSNIIQNLSVERRQRMVTMIWLMLPLSKRQPYVQRLLILPRYHQHPKLIRHRNHLEVSLDSSELQHHTISPAFRAIRILGSYLDM